MIYTYREHCLNFTTIYTDQEYIHLVGSEMSVKCIFVIHKFIIPLYTMNRGYSYSLFKVVLFPVIPR